MSLNMSGNTITTGITYTSLFTKRVCRDGLVFSVDAGDANSYNGSGNWLDLSGNGYNGTLYNSPTFTATSPGYFSFNGSTQYMQADVSTTTLDGDPDFTVEMFVRRTATLGGTTGGYWGIGGSGTGNSVEGWTPTDNLIHLDCYSSTRIGAGQNYPLNTWVHVVWVKRGSTLNYLSTVFCFINGVIATLSCSNANGNTPNLNTSSSGKGICIGRINGDTSAYYGQCDMSIFRVYNKVLNPYQVAENFQAQRVRFGL